MIRRLDKQTGVAALWLLVLVVGLVAALGTYLSNSRANIPPVSDKKAELAAASISEQGTFLIGGVNQMLTNGRALTEITDSQTDDGSAGAYGLYHPTAGGAQTQVPNKDAVVNATTKWVFKIDSTKTTDATRAMFNASGVGTATADYAFVLPDVSLSACRQINFQQHQTALTAEPDPVTTGALADFTTAANSVVTDAVKHAGWQSGCVKTTDNKYAYFVVVKPN